MCTRAGKIALLPVNLEIPSIQLRHRSWDSMTHDTCTRLASCSCRKSPAEKAIQVHTGQMSSKTIIIGLIIFRCGNECTSQIAEDFASWCKLKTFRWSLKRISTYRVYILFPNLSSWERGYRVYYFLACVTYWSYYTYKNKSSCAFCLVSRVREW